MNTFGAANAVPAAQILIAIIPIVGIVMGAVVIFFYLLWRHREVVKQIKNGTYVRPSFDIHLFCLLAGLLLAGIGLVLFLLFFIIDGLTYTLLGGLIPLTVGISLLAFYYVTRKDKKQIEPNNQP